jgi:hypothetical protein
VGVDFMVYGTLRDALPVDATTGQPATVPKLLAGAIAGAVGQTVAYPLDTIRWATLPPAGRPASERARPRRVA